VQPYDTVPVHWTHWDLAVCHALVRQKVAAWEQAHPGWQLEPDYERQGFASTAPSPYVDRETTIGRKQVRARFRVVRAHGRGRARRLIVARVAHVAAVVLRPPERWRGVLSGLDTETGLVTVLQVPAEEG